MNTEKVVVQLVPPVKEMVDSGRLVPLCFILYDVAEGSLVYLPSCGCAKESWAAFLNKFWVKRDSPPPEVESVGSRG